MVVLLVGLASLILSFATLVLARRSRINAEKTLRRARHANEEAHEALQHAQQRMGGEITVKHLTDPVLGPRNLLMVILPDPDWEIIHESGSEFPTTIVADNKRAMEAYANAHYVVGVLPNSPQVLVAKWLEYPPHEIKVIPYGAE